MLIGISGKKRVGKDTVGHWLEVKHDFTRVSFASLLKKKAMGFGWNGRKDEQGRKLLQDLGVVVRNYDPDFWADAAFREIAKLNRTTGQTNFVVTDVRFRNEAQRIKDAGGILIRVTREDEISNDLHVSETELDNYEFDYIVDSILGDLNLLYSKIDKIVVKELMSAAGATN